MGQSGIFAGDSGFNIIVSGNTALKGGALASDNFADSHLRTAKGAACTTEKTQYWNDLLMSVAEATTDSAREQMGQS